MGNTTVLGLVRANHAACQLLQVDLFGRKQKEMQTGAASTNEMPGKQLALVGEKAEAV